MSEENTDRELLELAAKAAGIDLQHKAMFGGDSEPGYYERRSGKPEWVWWNPLQDDGDALRLAVKVGLTVMETTRHKEEGRCFARVIDTLAGLHCEPHGADPYAATRRAVVRAAAALQRHHSETLQIKVE